MDSRAQPPPPAAREDGLLVEEIGRETVVYDVETKEAHALSPVAAAVFAGSDGRKSFAELAAFAAERVQEPVTDDEVWDALVQLEDRNLLKPPSGGLSRRGFVRTGAGIAISAPLVTSLVMPSIASAVSCSIGAACMTDTDCGLLKACMNNNCSTCRCVPVGSLGFASCGPWQLVHLTDHYAEPLRVVRHSVALH